MSVEVSRSVMDACFTAAYLEGSCADAGEQGQRVGYCAAYDLAGDRIRAMRAYGALAAFTAAPALN